MAPRTRSSPLQKASWRGRSGPVSSSLLFYRRLVMTALSAALLAGFALLIWFNWTANPSPLAASLHLSDYSRGSAPPLAFADKDAQAIESLLAERFKAAVLLGANQAADAENLGRALRLDDPTIAAASPQATLLVYVAAHGCSETVEAGSGDEDKAFLLPVDFDPSDKAKAGLPVGELLAALARQRQRNKVLAIDFGSIEHDLRLGTAVNRFADVLDRELSAIKLAADERLVVITSHRTWERSFVVPGQTPRSVFGYCFGAALGEPGHETDHADLTRYDGGQPDRRISVAELAWFVQRQVSDWVWNATDFQRTQQPLVLVKRGNNSVVRLELAGLSPGQLPAEGSDEARELAALGEVMLCRVPDKPAPASEEKQRDTPAAKDGAGKSASWQPYREAYASGSPLAMAIVAQAPATQPVPTPAAAPPAAAPAAPAAATAPPPATVEDQRPPWLRDQADDLGLLLALEANPFTPVPAWRDQFAALLDEQQRVLAGLDPRRSGGARVRPRVAPAAAQWPPKSLAALETATWSKAIAGRNALLLQLPVLAECADRLEGDAGDRVRSKLAALASELETLLQLVDRDALVESKGNTLTTVYQPFAVTPQQTDVAALAQPLAELAAAHQELLAELKGALHESGAAAWLNAWELGQTLPLALVDPKADGELADGELAQPPLLAVQPPRQAGERPPREPPQGVTQDGVADKVAARRRAWLAIQTRIAALLDSSEPLLEASLGGAGPPDRQLNLAALAIRRRHEDAVRSFSQFDGNRSQSAGKQWLADRTARLAVSLSGPPASLPFPPGLLRPEPTKVLLGLSAVRAPASEEGTDHAAMLSLTKPHAAAWNVATDNPDVLARVLVEVSYREADLVVTDRAGKRIAPHQPGAVLRLVDLLDGNVLALGVLAAREVGVDEARLSEGNRKELSVKLRLDEQTVSAPVTFRLPDSRYLDVLVAGHRATLERGHDELADPLPAGWTWRRALPDDAAARRGRDGDFRLEVSPFPRGQSHFRLKLVNRAEKPRKLVATWHVPKSPAALMTDWLKWQQAIDEATCQKFRAPAADSKQLAAGEPWEPPLFVPPAPPAAGAAAAPPPMPEVLSIEAGLLLVLTDELESGWQQRIWLRARPLHPQEYLEMTARFRPAPPSDRVEVSLNSTSAIRAQLPPAELEVKWFDRADDRIQPPPPAPRDFSLAADQPPITAEIAPGVRLTSDSLLKAILEIDGYPRAAHFPAIPRIGEPVEHRREPYVRLELFEETLPAAPMPTGGAAPPVQSPGRPLADREAFNRIPRLGYAVFADFADRRGQSLRLTQNGNVGSALARWPLDRRFVVKCRKPPDPLGPQLAMDCEVHEWAGSLGSDIRWLRPGKNVIRAEIVELVGGQERPLAEDKAQDELVIVLDTAGPQITSQTQAKFERFVGEPVEISFTIADSDPGKEEETSGVDPGQIVWGTKVEKGALVAPQPIAALFEPGSIKPNQQTFRCELPPDATKDPVPTKVFIQATDRAGNVSRAVEICEIAVRKPRSLDNRGGAGKPAVGK
jgi:hypothetical protein